MAVVRLIKKQDLTNARLTGLSFTERPEKPLPSPAIPAWLDAASRSVGPGAQSSASDPKHLEKIAYENGYRLGEKAGRETAENRVEEAVRRYAEAIVELGKIKPMLYAQAERNVVKLALEVAKKVVHREVQADREIIQTLIKVALGRVTVKSAVTIRLHPKDHEIVLAQRAALAVPGENDREITLVPDNSIERGGCLIETECGDVDARIEEQFHEVERTFFDGRN